MRQVRSLEQSETTKRIQHPTEAERMTPNPENQLAFNQHEREVFALKMQEQMKIDHFYKMAARRWNDRFKPEMILRHLNRLSLAVQKRHEKLLAL